MRFRLNATFSLKHLSPRLANIEGDDILEKAYGQREFSDNVFDFVLKEELGIEENVSLVETPEYLTEPDTDEIRYIESGLLCLLLEDEEIVYEPLAEEEEETHSNNPDDLGQEYCRRYPFQWGFN